VRVVSENSETDLQRKRAESRLDQSLRELTANLLRVVRGAGRAYDVEDQIRKAADAFGAFREVAGYGVGAQEIDQMLSGGLPPEITGPWSDARERQQATEMIVRGSLQMTAAELLGQHLQVAAGRQELGKGVQYLHEMRERAQEERRQTERAQRAAKKALKSKPAPKRPTVKRPKAP